MIQETLLLLDWMKKACPIKSNCCVVFNELGLEMRWEFKIKDKLFGYSRLLALEDMKYIKTEAALLELTKMKLNAELEKYRASKG